MKMKLFVLVIALSLLLSGMLVVVGGEATDGGSEVSETGESEIEPEELADSPWPSFGRDKKNTRRSPYDTSHVVGMEKWSFSTGNDVGSSPAIGSDGTIYVGSNDNNLYAVNPEDGTEKWSFGTGGEMFSSPAIGSDGTIYVGSNDNNLYAVNPEDGTEKWSFGTGGEVLSSPAIGSNGTIYVGSADTNVYAVNPEDGTEKWSFGTGGPVRSSLALEDDGTIYVSSADTNVYAVNPEDGTEKWSFTTGDPVVSSPAVGSDGTIYIGSYDGNLYAINSDGTEKWSFEIGDDVTPSPAIAGDGTIYVGSNDTNLYAVNPDGSEKWSFTTDGPVFSSPAIGGNGTVYVGSADYNLYAVNPEDGTEKWSFGTGERVFSSPAIGGNGTVYVGSIDNNVYAIGEEQQQGEAVEIHDWHDLDAVRDDQNGHYVLMDDLDKDTAGYDEYNTKPENREVRRDAGTTETWDDGDTINISFEKDEYDSVLSVEDGDDNPINHTVDFPTITIEENTETRYVYVNYENYVLGWTPIGTFTGTFDGKGHEIRDLYIDRGSEDLGLFDRIDGATIMDVGIVDANVNGESPDTDVDYVGALVGRAVSGGSTISNAYATGKVNGSSHVGLLLGENDYSNKVSKSYVAGDVSGETLVGGLVGSNGGRNEGGAVENSYARANVSGEDGVGGLVGDNSATVENSYATGDVSGDNEVGGLVGDNEPDGTISHSYAAGDVSKPTIVGYIGGLVGDNSETVSNSYWDVEATGLTDGFGDNSGDFDAEGLNTSEMQGDSAEVNMDALDFENTWKTVAGDYPPLAWEDVEDGGGTITKPSAPQNLQASVGDEQVELTWDAPSDDGGSSITEYKIYRGTSSGSLSQHDTVDGSTTSYTDTGLTNDQTYYYQVSAVNGEGESDLSAEVSATPSSDINTPSAPQNLQASVGDEQVNLSWDAPSDDGGSSITEYKIYRGTSSEDLTQHDTVDGSTTSYTDTGLTNDQTYYYQVSAVNGEGEGDLSAEVSATPSAEDGQNGDGTDDGTDNETDNETDGDGGGIPGFTSILLLLSAVIAIAIYHEKRR